MRQKVRKGCSCWAAGILALACLGPGRALAQAYEGQPCRREGNQALRSLAKGVPLETLDSSLTGAYTAWSTSMLIPKGKPPTAPRPAEDDELNEAALARDEWTCTHSAERLTDGKPGTAWCEGVEGDGQAELVVAQVDARKRLRIWAGYGKSAALHRANNRPRKVRVWVLAGRSLGAHQTGVGFGDLQPLGRKVVELADRNGYQPLSLPRVAIPDEAVTFVALEILSVYPGRKHRDTCVSEIQPAP
jgi:hypothetical protein